MSSIRPAATVRRGQRRARVIPIWRSRPAIAAFVLVACAAVGGLSWWAWHARLPQQVAGAVGRSLVQATASIGFTVREVFVVGRKETPRGQILAALAVRKWMPIFDIDLSEARQRILALPWVREASVERQLPDMVLVRIVERRPMALWQNRGAFTVIDEHGQVIQANSVSDQGQMVVVVGEDAPAHAVELLQMLATEPDLERLVKAAVRVGGRRWNLHLDGDIDVRLPERDAAGAWRRLGQYQREHRLLDKGLRTLDLRIADRVILRRASDKDLQDGVAGDDA